MACIAIVAAVLACTIMPASSQHITTEGPKQKGAVTPEDIAKRLETRAGDVQKMAPRGAQRFVLFDLAWPENAEEYRALGRHAVVLVIALSQNAEELPLRRVFTVAGKEIALQRVWSARRDVPEGSVTRTIFGAYREDAIYIVPAGPFMRDYLLACDFAKNRDNFVINRAELDPPDFIHKDRNRGSSSKPAPDALKAIIAREFPGFGTQ